MVKSAYSFATKKEKITNHITDSISCPQKTKTGHKNMESE